MWKQWDKLFHLFFYISVALDFFLNMKLFFNFFFYFSLGGAERVSILTSTSLFINRHTNLL